jgi:hypothetical protein
MNFFNNGEDMKKVLRSLKKPQERVYPSISSSTFTKEVDLGYGYETNQNPSCEKATYKNQIKSHPLLLNLSKNSSSNESLQNDSYFNKAAENCNYFKPQSNHLHDPDLLGDTPNQANSNEKFQDLIKCDQQYYSNELNNNKALASNSSEDLSAEMSKYEMKRTINKPNNSKGYYYDQASEEKEFLPSNKNNNNCNNSGMIIFSVKL